MTSGRTGIRIAMERADRNALRNRDNLCGSARVASRLVWVTAHAKRSGWVNVLYQHTPVTRN